MLNDLRERIGMEVGDVVLISCRIYPGRDAVHAHQKPTAGRFTGGVLFTAVRWSRRREGWRHHRRRTTASTGRPDQGPFSNGRLRVVIGKVGMGQRRGRLPKSGAGYLNGIGCAAPFYAAHRRVDGVSADEFGTPGGVGPAGPRVPPWDQDAHGNIRTRTWKRRRGRSATSGGERPTDAAPTPYGGRGKRPCGF